MNLKHLDNQSLVNKTKSLVLEEKKLTLEILHYLKEIQSRNLYLILGFSSLFDFATRALGYSASAAQRRIESMRLLNSVSDSVQIEEKVKTGELSLSTLAMTQSFFKAEKKENRKIYTPEQKQEILNNLSGKSAREAEKELVKLSPNYNPVQYQEREKQVSEDKILLQFTIDEELKLLLNQVKDLVACPQDRNPSLNTVLKKMAKFYLDKKDPSLTKPKTSESKKETVEPKSTVVSQTPTSVVKKTETSKVSRYIPIDVKRRLSLRAQVNGRARCEYKNPQTKDRCSSTYGLEVEHVLPFAWNAQSDFSNLELLCHNHNKLRATQFFGPIQIQKFKGMR